MSISRRPLGLGLALLVAGLLAVLTACAVDAPAAPVEAAPPPSPAVQTLDGIVVGYVPLGSHVSIELQDVTRSDAPTTVLANQWVVASRGTPASFSLQFDPADILADQVYALLVNVFQGDNLVANSNSANLVLTGGNPVDNVTIEVVPADDAPTAGAATGETAAQLANPASTNCVELGGESQIRTDADGAQYGVCVFDGYECDEWELLRGECADHNHAANAQLDQTQPEPDEKLHAETTHGETVHG